MHTACWWVAISALATGLPTRELPAPAWHAAIDLLHSFPRAAGSLRASCGTQTICQIRPMGLPIGPTVLVGGFFFGPPLPSQNATVPNLLADGTAPERLAIRTIISTAHATVCGAVKYLVRLINSDPFPPRAAVALWVASSCDSRSPVSRCPLHQPSGLYETAKLPNCETCP